MGKDPGNKLSHLWQKTRRVRVIAQIAVVINGAARTGPVPQSPDLSVTNEPTISESRTGDGVTTEQQKQWAEWEKLKLQARNNQTHVSRPTRAARSGTAGRSAAADLAFENCLRRL
jgi:hypothetical protein